MSKPSKPILDPSREALMRRVVACRQFQWIPGMIVMTTKGARPKAAIDPTQRMRVLDVVVVHKVEYRRDNTRHMVAKELVLDFRQGCSCDPLVGMTNACFPDFTDPATVGCLLAMVREAWGKLELYCAPVGDGKWAVKVREDRLITGDSEAEALVAALEDAP